MAFVGRRGVTVIEVLCVLAIAVVLLIVVNPERGRGAARMTAAMTELQSLKSALDSFHVDNGFYPGTNGLQDLVQEPSGATNWRGPYVVLIPKDPWGRDYIYECPGKHTAAGYPYDLLSLGLPGSSNPIANWSYHLKPL